MKNAAELYDEDFYAWTQDQAASLRLLARQRWNGPLDLENLSEEVEHLGRAATNICLGQIERLIQHLLKLEYSPAEAPRRQWQLTVHDARRELHRQLTPTIRRLVEAELPELAKAARNSCSMRHCQVNASSVHFLRTLLICGSKGIILAEPLVILGVYHGTLPSFRQSNF